MPPPVDNAINYLLSAQNQSPGDKGWPVALAGTTDALTTAQVLRAIVPYSQAFPGLQQAIVDSSATLLAAVTSASPVHLQAMTALALLSAGDATGASAFLDQLVALQEPMGSWNGDVYDTVLGGLALAVGAGAAAEALAPEVSIPDSRLRQAVNAGLGRNAMDALRVGEMRKLTMLDAAGKGISDLSGIEESTGLTYADLRNNNIQSLVPLVGLTSLGTVLLQGNNLSDLEDADGDGLSDYAEMILGTNPLVADTDGDGFVDGSDDYPLDPLRWDFVPVAAFSSDVTSGPAPLTVRFTDESIVDDGLESRTWNFGDGTPVYDVEEPGHIFTWPGTYMVSLTVIDSDGSEDTVTGQITVQNASGMVSTSPYRHYVLNPRLVGKNIGVVSLADQNVIRAGDTVLVLGKYEHGTIPGTAVAQGTEIWGSAAFSLGADENGTDLPVPASFAGTEFVIPHLRNSHRYYLLSPDSDAQVTVELGAGNVTNLVLAQGVVSEVDAGSDNTIAGIISADVPILVAHKDSGTTDAYPVPPAMTTLYGIRSNNAWLAGLIDGTSVQVYTSSGTGPYGFTVNRGQRVVLNVGVAGVQGSGDGLKVVADQPVAAVQYADGDGSETTAFLAPEQFGSAYGLPVDSQYVAVVCPHPGTDVTLHPTDGLSQTVQCFSDGLTPGKAFFGSTSNSDLPILEGAYLTGTRPFYAIYEKYSDDEHNLTGYRESHYVLSPRSAGNALQILSLAEGNEVSAGASQLVLDRYQSATVPGIDVVQGLEIQGTAPLVISGAIGAADMPVPATFAATRFVVPHARDSHTYYLLSPYRDTDVHVDLGQYGAMVIPLTKGIVTELVAGDDNTIGAVFEAGAPILLAHLGEGSWGGPSDAFPVPPPATELWGVRSNSAVVAALEDDTVIEAFGHDGSGPIQYNLDRGMRQGINVGVSGPQGTGSGIRLVANKPIAAVQFGDGDGGDATAFFPTLFLGTRHGIPVESEYIAVVCPYAQTGVTLYDGINPPQSGTCQGDDVNPGKVYFTAPPGMSSIGAGARVESDLPVYLIFEEAVHNDEHNVLGTRDS